MLLMSSVKYSKINKYLKALVCQSKGDDGHVGDVGAVYHVFSGSNWRSANRLLNRRHVFCRTRDQRSSLVLNLVSGSLHTRLYLQGHDTLIVAASYALFNK